MNKQRSKKSKLVALLLSFAMLITMFPSGMFAAAGDAQDVTGGINGFQATLQADEDTSGSYKTAFGNMPSAAYNGKVWADKSVEINGDGKTFDVTLSALGQTYDGQTSTETKVAYDVMFVLDTSGSMDGQKFEDAAGALNSAMNALLEGEGTEHNRVGITTFADNANNSNNIFLPLGHHEKRNNRSNFISYEEGGMFSNDTITVTTSEISGKQVKASGGTYTQGGIDSGVDALNNSSKPDDGVVHYPVVILLTDGEPTYYCTDVDNVNDRDKGGNGQDSSNTAYTGSLTVQTAAAYKNALTENYRERYSGQDVSARFYTIGQNLSGSYAETLLNPTKEKLQSVWGETSWGNQTKAAQLAQLLFESYQQIDDRYSYADGSYTGEMNQGDLEEIFQSIIKDISQITGGVNVGEDTGGRNKMNFYDTLGEGVSFTGEAQLTVPTWREENGQMVTGDTRVYDLHFEATTANEGLGINIGAILTGENGPAYIQAGGVAKAKAVSVNGGNLDAGNAYDKSVQDELTITVRQLENGKRQLNYYIPAQLMAYNVLNTTTNAYFESAPIQLSYGVQLRNDTDEAGSYLIGEPGQTYMEFYPSSAQNDNGTYKMPYYRPDGQFEKDPATIDKTGTGIAGADNYISSTQFLPSNSVVRIDLGNNGLYNIDGKAMTFHLFWNDANDQDGQRPETVTMQLYREAVSSDSTVQPDQPTNPQKYDEIILGLSNVAENNANMWEFTTDQLPVYDDQGNIYRYWAQITKTDLGDYTVSLNNSGEHNNGFVSEDGTWLCFSVEEGLLTNAKLDVKLSHTPATVTYNVVKDWDSSTGDAKDTETSVSVQLYANGQAVSENGTDDGTNAPFTITKDGDGAWEKALTLPKYKNGEEVLYSFVEQGDKYTALVDYGALKDNERTVTITNYASLGKTTLTAVKEWSDGNDQDGIRPESVKLKLTAKVDDEAMPDDELANLIGVEKGALTQEVGTASDWLYTWKDLPKQNAEDQAVTYSAVEVNAPEGYEPSVNTDLAGYALITNTHAPETTTLTINKDWKDGENQDGLRPSSISGTIYKKVGDVDKLIPVSSYVVDASGTYTTAELPAKEDGKTLTYYVTENAVNEYTTSADTEAQKIGNVTAYPFKDGKITLTNTHEVSTQDYTATFTWYDKSAATRPDTVTVNLTATVGGAPTDYPLTLTVGDDGAFTDVSGDLPGGASASVKDGPLRITGLPMSQGGKTIYYSMGNAQADGYTTAITGTTYNSTEFTLTRVDTPISLGFTKVWEDTGHENMRPGTKAYAQYLTLKADGEEVSARPTVEARGDNYVVTYTNLDEYNADGTKIKYTVEENTVPNYTNKDNVADLTADNSDKITNTFEQEVYESISLTKVWDDADGKDKRPSIDNAKDLNIRLYEAGAGINADSGIEPTEIKVNPENENEWIFTWNDVPKTDVTGDAIQYVAHENNAPDDYTASGDVKIVDGKAEGTLTNTLDGGAVATGNLTIEKKWVDEGFEDNRGEVTVEVLSQVDGEKQQIVDTITLNGKEDTPWTKTLEDQPITSGGNDITYSVRETKAPAGYTAIVSEPVTLTKERKTLTVTNTYSAEKWTVTYNGNGGTGTVPTDDTEYSVDKSKATVKDGSGLSKEGYVFIGWTTEQNPKDVENSDQVPSTLYQNGAELTLTGNTTLYAVWAIDKNGDKIPDYQNQVIINVDWADDSNRCGIRPTSLKATLNGENVTIDLNDVSGVLVTTSGENTRWIYTTDVKGNIAGLSDGSLVIDDAIETIEHPADNRDTIGYRANVKWDSENNCFNVTLTHTPETITHHVTKTWDFENSQISQENATATIELMANGKVVEGQNPITFTPNASEPLEWKNLPKYEGGQLINYRAIETQVLNGDEDVTDHFRVDYESVSNEKTTMNNTYTEYRNITLIYSWDDNNDVAGERPQSVTVALFAGEDVTEPMDGTERTISEDSTTRAAGDNNTWDLTWTNLPIYEDDGVTPIIYQARVISYVAADGTTYENLGNGLTEGDQALIGTDYSFDFATFGINDSVIVINSALTDSTTYAVEKKWEGDQDTTLVRPNSVWVSLLQNGTVYQSAELSADNEWKASWNDLPTINATDGTEYNYTVVEQKVPTGYQAAYDTTMTPGTTVITNSPEDAYKSEYTVTFVYEHASATDAKDNAITAPITVKHDGSLQFTAKADSGYILQTPSYNGSATMEANGSTYTLKNIKSDVTVTIKAEKQNQGGGGGGGIIITPPDDKPELERGDHFAYIVGYEDETIRPQNNITRAEVATIFFRLLTDESREHYFTDDNSAFSDMTGDHWYDNAVATLTNAGIIAGYPDGTFRPNDPITRAEFAAIATRFDDLEPVPSRFTDIDGHWAEDAINAAYGAGWVGGYPDGTFLPNKNITRAEVMSLVNRVLDRNVDIDGMLDDMLTWVDNEPSDWFYEAVQEATNSHDYEREEGEEFETWTKITEPRDWTKLEEDLLAGLDK